MSAPAKTTPRPRSIPARIRAFGRLGGYLAFVFAVVTVLALYSLRASAGETSLTLGRELSKLGDVMTSTKRLVLNGQVLFVSTAGTDQSVGMVLDRFESMCGEHAAAMAEELARLPEPAKVAVTKGILSRGLGILRKQQGDDEGIVACFANDEPGGATAILARARELVRTGDLSALGRLRYVYASKTPRGGTHVITVWTDGAVRLGEMFPADGDARGSDSDLVPRPRDARRLLTAQIDDSPYAVRVYDSKLARDAYFAELVGEMDRRGWMHVAPPNDDGTARAFLRGDGVEIIATAASEEDRTLVTLVEMGRR